MEMSESFKKTCFRQECPKHSFIISWEFLEVFPKLFGATQNSGGVRISLLMLWEVSKIFLKDDTAWPRSVCFVPLFCYMSPSTIFGLLSYTRKNRENTCIHSRKARDDIFFFSFSERCDKKKNSALKETIIRKSTLEKEKTEIFVGAMCGKSRSPRLLWEKKKKNNSSICYTFRYVEPSWR